MGNTRTRVPEIYIVWHPNFKAGGAIAARIYQWLRPGYGLGPDVYYRSIDNTRASRSAPIDIPGDNGSISAAAQHASWAGASSRSRRAQLIDTQIIIVLAECEMVADHEWRAWLKRQASTNGNGLRREFIPVSLDSTAFNLPEPLSAVNYIRPIGPEAPTGDGLTIQSLLVNSLLKQLTETLCRLMLDEQGPDDSQTAVTSRLDAPMPRLSIFLSHAKADGTEPARLLRDYVFGQTTFVAFYDENDVPYGAAFKTVIDRALSDSRMAAMIAVRSSQFASRAWCRREVSAFRQPRLLSPAGATDGFEFWRLGAVLVVDSLEPGEPTLGVPEFGNATHIRWDATIPGLEERIVTTVLRDALLAQFHTTLGYTAHSHLPESAGRTLVLNWVPDPTSLLLAMGEEPASRVLHPGHGLSGVELQILKEFFPGIEFSSFEEMMDEPS